MGVALKIGKLSAVAWFGENRGSRTLPGALFALVGVLMCLNAIGAYGFLARAHISQSLNRQLGNRPKPIETQGRFCPRLEKKLQLMEDFGRIATRYDKLARNFFSGVCLVTALVYWM
jgi:hypothetical protein